MKKKELLERALDIQQVVPNSHYLRPLFGFYLILLTKFPNQPIYLPIFLHIVLPIVLPIILLCRLLILSPELFRRGASGSCCRARQPW